MEYITFALLLVFVGSFFFLFVKSKNKIELEINNFNNKIELTLKDLSVGFAKYAPLLEEKINSINKSLESLFNTLQSTVEAGSKELEQNLSLFLKNISSLLEEMKKADLLLSKNEELNKALGIYFMLNKQIRDYCEYYVQILENFQHRDVVLDEEKIHSIISESKDFLDYLNSFQKETLAETQQNEQ